MTPMVTQRLKSLHPQQDLSDLTDIAATPYHTPPSLPDEDDVAASMRTINMEAPGGPSGWNPRHLKIAMRSATFTKFITMYAGMMATNTAPGRHIMTVCDGIGLMDLRQQLTQTSKLRPIDMSEIIYKVCVVTCMRKNRRPAELPTGQRDAGRSGTTDIPEKATLTPVRWRQRRRSGRHRPQQRL